MSLQPPKNEFRLDPFGSRHNNFLFFQIIQTAYLIIMLQKDPGGAFLCFLLDFNEN